MEWSGGLAVCLPYTRGPTAAEEIVQFVDGLLLSGGGDVSPLLYGEDARVRLRSLAVERDEWEISLINAVLALEKPLLAICRGVQVLNVALGGTLHQDISALGAGLTHEGEGCSHPVDLERSSRLRRIVGRDRLIVNSSHHQAINRTGRSLSIAARSPDGIVEAVELSGEAFALGVQWHPERSYMEDPASREIFRDFIRACAISRKGI